MLCALTIRSPPPRIPPRVQLRDLQVPTAPPRGAKRQVKTGGAGGARTHDPGIMSTCGLSAVLTWLDAGRLRASEVGYPGVPSLTTRGALVGYSGGAAPVDSGKSTT
jgi:hypothetical protein